jgi:PAS domain S-box-containing protein
MPRGRLRSSLCYLYAFLTVAAALGIRILLVPWTGQGAPFVLFFGAVVISGFLWGAGPSIMSGVIAAPIAAYLFVYRAGYTVSQTAVQTVVFLVEVLVVGLLANRFAKAKRLAELNEGAARHAEAQVKKWQNIFEDAAWGIVVMDAHTGAIDMANPGFASMLGYRVEELIGVPITEIFTPEAGRDVEDCFRKADELGHCAFESVQRRKDGGVLPVMADVTSVKNDYGELVYRSLNIRDLTETYQARLALQKSEAELREAQRLAHVGNWNWDAANDAVTWSEEIYRIFGLDSRLPAPPFYSGHQRLFTPESMARLEAAVADALKHGKAYEIELELIRPDGATRWIAARAEPVRDASGGIAGLYGTVQDITQLRHLMKMREEWTSVVAHDLRQPIGNITMSVDLLARLHIGEMNEREKLMINRIRSAASNLARMVDDLLDVARMESKNLHVERNWIDPRAVVRESIERLSYITKGAHIRVLEAEELVPVFADAVRIEQVLGNLISNAVKYGDPGREILIRLEPRNDNEIEILVTNHSKGIPPDELPHLFDRFSRSKSVRGSGVPGLGLGLYIAKGIIEAHGGRIWAESVTGGATTFHFTIPIHGGKEKGIA